MKNKLTLLTFFAMTTFAFSQQEQQTNDDQLQQQAPRETQVQVERSARRDAKKQKVINRKEVRRIKKEVRLAKRDTVLMNKN